MVAKLKTEVVDIESLDAQIEELQKKRDEIVASQKAEIREALVKTIKRYGFTAAELGLVTRDIVKRAPPKPKYRDGDKTWSGKGKRPSWLTLGADGKIEPRFLIKD